MNNVDYIKLYETYLKNEKKASDNTCVSYIRDIIHFSDYLDFHFRIESLFDVERPNIEEYILWLRENGKTDSTIIRKIASLKNFYSFLFSKNFIDNNPTKDLVLQKAVQKMPEILTINEINLLLSQPDLLTRKGLRDKAMLELLYATGIRVSELLQLTISDIFIKDRCIRCTNGNKERYIPIYAKAAEILDNYIKFVRPTLIAFPDEKAVFVNTSGEMMTRQGFWKVIKKYQKDAGIKKDITPHTLRHSFAVHLLENGADIVSVQEMMGHASLASTSIYSKFVNQKIADVYNNSHPRA